MGTVGGLISPDPRAHEHGLSTALSRSSRADGPVVLIRGDVSVGIGSQHHGRLDLASGARWTVALAGDIDRIAENEIRGAPAAAIARELDRRGEIATCDVVGEFTCVATDGARLIAFRDHVGSAGLFVGTNGSTGCVMSEPKQVAAALGKPRRADIDALVNVFFAQSESDEEVPCVIEGVDRVPRGFLVSVNTEGWNRVHRLWDPADLLETSDDTVAEAVEKTWALVSRAVRRATRGATAISLSGGIDSTLIAAAMSDLDVGNNTGTISAVYPNAPSVDESSYIRMTTERLKLTSSTYEPIESRLADVSAWVDRFDGPTYGLAIGPVAELNNKAREEGYETVLSGELAELVYDLREHAIGRIMLRGRLITAGRHIAGLRRSGMGLKSLSKIIGATLTPSAVALRYTSRRGQAAPAPWMIPSFLPGLGRRWDLERPPSKRWSDIQLFFAKGPSFPGLEVASIMGDHAGVMTRRPLIDRDLWEYFLSLPPEIKFPDSWTKSLVRRAIDNRVPREVVRRTDKTVFDEDARAHAEYDQLLIRLNDNFRLPGIDYTVLGDRLRAEDMGASELALARYLASVHSFNEVVS